MIYSCFDHADKRLEIELRTNICKVAYEPMGAAAPTADWSVPPDIRIKEDRASFAGTFAHMMKRISHAFALKRRRNSSSWFNQTIR